MSSLSTRELNMPPCSPRRRSDEANSKPGSLFSFSPMGAAEGICEKLSLCSRCCTLSPIPLLISYTNPRLDHLSTSSPIRLEARMYFIYLSPRKLDYLKTWPPRRWSGKLIARSLVAWMVCFSTLTSYDSSKRITASSTKTDHAAGAALLSASPNPVPAGSPDQELSKATISSNMGDFVSRRRLC